VRVLVADNSPIHSELLANAIGKDRHITVVGFSSNSTEVLRAVLESAPEVLLISATLDERPGHGLDVLKELLTSRPDLKAVVLLDSASQELVVRAFRAGARGIFCRNEPVKTLCKCVCMVHQGQVWANTRELGFVLEALAHGNSLSRPDPSALKGLSERERDVVHCLAEGLTNRDIADRLGISQHTVKNYMFRIFEKLGVSSRVQLLFFVLSRTGQSQKPYSKGGASRTDSDPASAKAQQSREPHDATVPSDPPASRKLKGSGSNVRHLTARLGSS
jgi:DNA-binding NarL/FixJ family response regulator